MNEEINRQLHKAAEAHRPDRGRMLARVERGMAGADVSHRKPGIAMSWPKVTLAGLAAAGVLATAGIAVAGLVHTTPPDPDTAVIPTITSPSGTSSSTPSAPAIGTPVPPPVQGQPNRTTADRPTSGTNPVPLTGKPVSDGPLSSLGSIDLHTHEYWAQSRFDLKTAQPLSALSVELRIVQTGGVRTSGQWQTMSGDDFTVTVQEIDGAVVYRWELKPGRTVPEGMHTFAAQYGHAEGKRDARADSYDAQATAAGGAFVVRGGFTT